MKMAEDLVMGVIDTIDSANQHQLQLSELLTGLEDAKDQIHQSASQSREKLKHHFSVLKAELLSALDGRLKILESKVDGIEADALQPLTQCEEIIQQDIKKTKQILDRGKKLLACDPDNKTAELDAFKKESNEQCLSSLPEVPSLSDVACIFVDLPETSSHLVAQISDHGRVISRAPVQISEIVEHPGSLVIKWAETEEESSVDFVEFRLQCHYGIVKAGDSPGHFSQIYQGPASSYTMRHTRTLSSYTFRVAGRAEGATAWSPWSVTHTAVATLPHYEWMPNTEGYTTSNENKLARRCGEASVEGPILYSKGSTYTCGHHIVFKIVEEGTASSEDCIALSTSCDKLSTLCNMGTLMVTSAGKVYLDGQEKTTKLPCLRRNSVLGFETEVLQSGKVRVTIEVDEKIVTFDWAVERPQQNMGVEPAVTMQGPQTNNNINLYFAIRFANEGWSVGVE